MSKGVDLDFPTGMRFGDRESVALIEADYSRVISVPLNDRLCDLKVYASQVHTCLGTLFRRVAE